MKTTIMEKKPWHGSIESASIGIGGAEDLLDGCAMRQQCALNPKQLKRPNEKRDVFWVVTWVFTLAAMVLGKTS